MPTSPLYRQIQPEDIDQLFQVRIATWHNDRGREELEGLGINHDSVCRLLQTTHRGWLCELGNRIVGFAMGDRSNGEMWVIAVLKEHEGLGIGRHLLELVEKWLFSQGWNEIWLTTDLDESLRAVGFYRRLGWSDWKLESGDRFMNKTRIRSPIKE